MNSNPTTCPNSLSKGKLTALQKLYSTKQSPPLNTIILNLYIKQSLKHLLGWQCNKQLYTIKKSIIAFERWFRAKTPQNTT